MKKLIIFVGIIALASGVRYLEQENRSGGLMRIAIVTPATHPALQEIETGFKETLERQYDKRYLFTTFNANGNRTLLRAQAEEVVLGDYDLIFTIGAGVSQTIAELLNKKRKMTPHLFAAVDGKDYAQSLTEINRSSVGVYVLVDYKKQMEILHILKPGIKNMLLVYDSTQGIGLEKHKDEIVENNKRYGIHVQTIEIYQTNEIQQKVSALVPTVDVVLVLIDNTVVAGIDALITLCNRYGVTLYASDLASGKKGAACAYGVTEYESGEAAAHKAGEILMHAVNPGSLGNSPITKFRIECNQQTMNAQRLSIDAQTLEKIEQVLKGDTHG